jgi:uncharacterized protein
MTLATAQSAIQYEFENSDHYDEIEFDLFGGEPALCQRLIQELVKWTEIKNFAKPYVFFLETNGTLVHGRFQEWLLQHRDNVCAGLSLDGTRETHNRNRSQSYDRIDIGFFLRTYPEQSVRMTVNSSTLHTLSADIIHLHTLGFVDIVATFAHGISWDTSSLDQVLKTELKNLCRYYLDNPELQECSLFAMDLGRIADRQPAANWCGAGTSMVSYSVDGKQYPCHTFQPYVVAAERALELGEFDFEHAGATRAPECERCFLVGVCPTCFGMSYARTGTMVSPDRGLCQILKTRAQAVAYLRAHQLARNSEPAGFNARQMIAAIKLVAQSC